MIRSSFFRAGLLLVLGSLAACAADISGAWSGSLAGPDGGDGFPISFTFKQDGAKLTGSVKGPQGDAIEISDGKVDGDKVSFSVSFNGTTFHHEGMISGEEIKLSMKSDGGGFPGGSFVLKKSKA
jgi:hypothetical protein